MAEPTFLYLAPKQDTDMKDTAGKLLSSLFRLDLFIYLLKLTLSVVSNFKCILYFYLIKIHGSWLKSESETLHRCSHDTHAAGEGKQGKSLFFFFLST